MVFRISNLTKRILTKGGIVAQYLNAADSRRRKRLLDLIEPIQRLTALLPDLMQGRPFGRNEEGRQFLWYNLAQTPESKTLLRKINRGLARYVFRRELPSNFFVFEDEPIALWTQQARPELRFPKNAKHAVRLLYNVPISEEHVVALVLDVAEAAALNRIRRCPNCRSWFMAHRSDQEFCRGECSRESYYKAHKEKWPEYQKDYRERKKQREEYQDKRRKKLNAKE
jgi:hypothetical protein